MIDNIKKNGVVFTPNDLADFMSKQALSNLKKDKSEELIILEPSAGDGALVYSIINNALRFGYKKIKLYAFDINQDFLDVLKAEVNKVFPFVDLICMCVDFINFAYTNTSVKADIIISNPPYVRIQNMEKKYLDFADSKLDLGGRIDLYHIFICLLDRVLSKNGVISIIVSNKFISNKAGISLRNYIVNSYSIDGIYDFGDTKMFSASVLPVVLIMHFGKTESEKAEFFSIYSSKDVYTTSNDLFAAIENNENYAMRNNELYKILYGVLCIENNSWSLKTNSDEEFLINTKANTKFYFSDFAKIKVGIKTTADKVFISDKWDLMANEKPELLRKLITHRVAGQYFSKLFDSYQVLYPYVEVSGKKKVVDLEEYPLTKKYLLSNYSTLSSRTYIQNSNKEWYEIWVPHTPSSWDKKKIVFRDIAEKPTFWLVDKGAVVNGDCYWFDFNDNITEEVIYLILAIANSTFIEKYYDLKFNNKLYSGRRRFMTQYVEKFPIFDPKSDFAKEIINILKNASKSKMVSSQDIETLNKLVMDGFNQKN